MKQTNIIQEKLFDLKALQRQVNRWRLMGKSIAFTNGCFDILHPGHLYALSQAAAEADYLIVGLNADTSVKKLKGDHRPINDQQSRALLIAALVMVDAVIVFEEQTPLTLINAILPDVLVKGGDYTIDQIVGAREVIASGGKVVLNSMLEGFSTTAIIERMR